MVRGGRGAGPFNTDFHIKLLFVLVTIAVCLYESRDDPGFRAWVRRVNYFGIFLVGTVAWTIMELVAQRSGIRQFQQPQLFHQPLPLWCSLPIQGAAEGGVVAIFGIFAGDRIIDPRTRKIAVAGLMISMGLLIIWALTGDTHAPAPGGIVPSRRNIFAPLSVVAMTAFSVFSVLFIWTTTPELRQRGLWMFMVMTLFASCWNGAEWMAGTRWVEVGRMISTTLAPPPVAFGAFVYDVVAEVSMPYLSFLAIAAFISAARCFPVRRVAEESLLATAPDAGAPQDSPNPDPEAAKR
jgi:hypothetical protein